jgi:hypothetical protein
MADRFDAHAAELGRQEAKTVVHAVPPLSSEIPPTGDTDVREPR